MAVAASAMAERAMMHYRSDRTFAIDRAEWVGAGGAQPSDEGAPKMGGEAYMGRRFTARLGVSLVFAMVCAGGAAVAGPPAPGIPGAEELGLPPAPTEFYAKQPVGTGAGPVTQEVLNRSSTDPGEWLLYGGGYRNFRHSPVAAITPATVKDLHVAWSAPTGTTAQFEASPVVYGGVMYVTTSYNRLLALDAKTGKFLWRYDVKLQPDTKAVLRAGQPRRRDRRRLCRDGDAGFAADRLRPHHRQGGLGHSDDPRIRTAIRRPRRR